MTQHTATTTNGRASLPHKSTPTRDRKPAKRKAASRRTAKRTAKNRTAAGGYVETASRFISRGGNAAAGASEWAADGARRALPLAARHMPDQRTLQNLLEERPLVLGAIGLGIGAMIGLMLPDRLRDGSASSRRIPANRKARKR